MAHVPQEAVVVLDDETQHVLPITDPYSPHAIVENIAQVGFWLLVTKGAKVEQVYTSPVAIRRITLREA